MEPGFGEALFAADGGHGDVEGEGGFVEGKAAEEAEFDDFGFAGVLEGEGVQGVIKGFEVAAAGRGEADDFVEAELFGTGTAFGAFAFADLINEDLPHEMGSDSEEVGPAFPIGEFLGDEAKVGFVDKGGGLESGHVALAAEVTVGQTVQFLIDERCQEIEGGFVAALPIDEKLGNGFGSRIFWRSRHWIPWYPFRKNSCNFRGT